MRSRVAGGAARRTAHRGGRSPSPREAIGVVSRGSEEPGVAGRRLSATRGVAQPGRAPALGAGGRRLYSATPTRADGVDRRGGALRAPPGGALAVAARCDASLPGIGGAASRVPSGDDDGALLAPRLPCGARRPPAGARAPLGLRRRVCTPDGSSSTATSHVRCSACSAGSTRRGSRSGAWSRSMPTARATSARSRPTTRPRSTVATSRARPAGRSTRTAARST